MNPPHSTTARSRPCTPSAARQTRIRVIADGVIASYIHDISTSSAIARRNGSRVHGRGARRLASAAPHPAPPGSPTPGRRRTPGPPRPSAAPAA